MTTFSFSANNILLYDMKPDYIVRIDFYLSGRKCATKVLKIEYCLKKKSFDVC